MNDFDKKLDRIIELLEQLVASNSGGAHEALSPVSIDEVIIASQKKADELRAKLRKHQK